MRHVDDGTIHAWLDEQITDPAEATWIDEHLRGCGECRVRVAEERATFDRAQTLLAGATPSGEQPSLESLVAKAGRYLQPVETPSDARLTRGGRDRVLILAGWAASLALAVGLGWTARELTDRDTVSQAPAPVVAGPSDVSVSPPAKPADVAQPLTGAPVTGAQASLQRAATATRPAVPDTSVESAVPAQGREASAPIAEAAQPAAPPVAAPSPPPPAAVQPREAALRQEAVTVTGVSAAPAAARVDTEWRTLPRTEAAARTGMPLYGLDGVEPLVTALSADGAAVRTIYRLASGETVELVQQRAAPDGLADLQATRRGLAGSGASGNAAVLGRVASPERTLSTVRGDVRVTLRTSSAGADLDALGAKLRFD